MGVRVKVEVRRAGSDRAVSVAALLNSGFESEVPELLIPGALACELGLLPDLPPDARTEEYVAIGGKVLLHRIERAVTVEVDAAGREEKPIECAVLISPIEREAILNDAAISKLGLDIADPRGGRWRFTDERELRSGVPPQLF